MPSKQRYLFVGTGYSKDDDPFKAGYNAVMNAAKDLEKDGCKKKPEFGFIFCSGSKYGKNDKTIKKFVEGANKAFKEINPNIKWVGGTTAGEICDKYIGFSSAVAMLIQSNYLFWGVGFEDNISKNPKEKTKIALKKAIKDTKIDKELVSYLEFLRSKKKSEKHSTRVIIVINKGFSILEPSYEPEVLESIKEELGQIPIVGVSTGDDLVTLKNYQFCNGRFSSHGLIIVRLVSELEVDFGFSHAYVPTDKVFIVTKVEGEKLKELNGQNAVKVYADAIGSSPKLLIETSYSKLKLNLMSQLFLNLLPSIARSLAEKTLKTKATLYSCYLKNPLAIYDPINKIYLPRVIDKACNEYLVVKNQINNGCVLTLMNFKEEKLHNSFREIFKDNKVNLIFECAGRRVINILNRGKEGYKIVNKQLKQELKLITTHPSNKTVGMLGYGEVGFIKKVGSNFYNHTIVSFSIKDKLSL